MDAAGAVVGLVGCAPLLLAAAVAIRLEDGGPVFFRQERIGENGHPFTMLKFRTMVVDAESRGLGLVTHREDDRITRVGRLLRATSIDELPQLINVVQNDMSLVGPRPTVRSQVDRYTPFQRRRLDVPAGLTGWAQINGRNGIPWARRIDLDVWYVDNRGTWLDFQIIARTLVTLVRGDGTYGAGGLNPDLESDTATTSIPAQRTDAATADTPLNRH
ncbi:MULTISPECIES: sugar transferase [unclassified Frankia]|uniref:sugar transferase n=1 Tax=unclassified Frankia TaxID=2632575 RepID=UPI002AD2E8C2|nr:MULTISPECIES: sugar transferase [unclassified Frankia]